MPQQLTVNEIRNRALTGEAKEVADFLIKQVDLARASAMGYAAVTILEGICDANECDDIMGWRREAVEAGIINLPDIPEGDDDDGE